jgi:hypothetical protein
MLRRLSPLVLLACLVLLFSLYASRGDVASAQAPSLEATTAVRAPVGSGFTYQGRLLIDSSPTSERHDFRFNLYDAATGGTLLGTELEEDVTVSDGLFSVQLDYGADDFTGEARWLEVAVRPDESTDEADFSTLAQRQPLTPAPYAIHAGTAATAPWDGLTGVPAGFADGVDNGGPNLRQVVWVAKSGGDFTTVQGALNSITDATSTKPYLIRIAPGVYFEQVTLKEHVALEGAGEGKTILYWTGANAEPFFADDSATVIGANNAELRLLTIQSVADTGRQVATALWNFNTAPTLIHVTATASGGDGSNYGVFNNSASPTMDNVTATASGGPLNYGVYNQNSSLRMTNVTATASGGSNTNYGVYSASSSLRMHNVTATASDGTFSNYGVYNTSASPTMDTVTATASGGSFSYGVYNDSDSSPAMTNVTAIASEGDDNYGVYNNNNTSSSPTMDNVTATASGGDDNYGVYNVFSSPTMHNVTATASGGDDSYGVYNASSAPRMDNVTATGSDGGNVNMGVLNFSSSPIIQDSTLTGSDFSVFRGGGGTVQVANTQLVGDVSSGVTCFDNYAANLAPVTCSP